MVKEEAYWEGVADKLSGKKFQKKYFVIHGFYLYWFTRKSSSAPRGLVNLVRSRFGLSKTRNMDGTESLILYPRNDGKTLNIKLNEIGMVLKKAVTRALSKIEYSKLFVEKVLTSRNPSFYRLCKTEYNHENENEINEKKSDFFSLENFDLEIKPLSAALKGRFVASLCYLSSILDLSLKNVRFTDDGLERLAIFLNRKSQKIQRLSLVNNGIEAYNSSQIIQAISESCIPTLKHIDLSQNNLGDAMAIKIIKAIGYTLKNQNSENSQIQNSNPIQFINLSDTGISDSTLLNMQFIYDHYPKNSPRELITLDVSNNFLSENGLGCLTNFLKNKRIVKSLNISNSKLLGPDFIDTLLFDLKESTSISEIDYTGNKLEEKCFKKIMNFLLRNMAICEFKISVKRSFLEGIDWH